jgi:beta-lactamase class D
MRLFPEEGVVLEYEKVVSDPIGLAHPQWEAIQALQSRIKAKYHLIEKLIMLYNKNITRIYVDNKGKTKQILYPQSKVSIASQTEHLY